LEIFTLLLHVRNAKVLLKLLSALQLANALDLTVSTWVKRVNAFAKQVSSRLMAPKLIKTVLQTAKK